MVATLLIVDDDLLFCEALHTSLMGKGYKVLVAGTLARARELLKKHSVDVVFIDVQLPDGNGLDLLSGLALLPDPPEAIVITAQGDPDGAEAAINTGAWDYVQKPAHMGDIQVMVQRALQMRERKQQMPAITGESGFVGNSRSMRMALLQMFEAAQSDAPALIIGETGTGKELIARTVHKNSRRAQGPFVVVDCGAISPTLLESELFGSVRGAFTGATQAREGLVIQADGGTLFLDEVGELTLDQQKVFLRLLQEHSFRPLGGTGERNSDFRIVAATNRNLAEMVDAGTFRPDLFFRLQGLTIETPPVRNRGNDVFLLVQHALRRAIAKYDMKPKVFASDALEALASYSWPGNVREILYTVEAAALTSAEDPLILQQHLSVHLRAQVARSRIEEQAPVKAAPLPPLPPLPAAVDSPEAEPPSPPVRTDARPLQEAPPSAGRTDSAFAASDIAPARGEGMSGQGGPAMREEREKTELPRASGSEAGDQVAARADASAAAPFSAPPAADAAHSRPSTWQVFQEQELFAVKRKYLLDLLAWAGGSVPAAAQAAGISRQRLYALLREHNITRRWREGE
ncbi:sigma-54 dependent transcriptional regulator [Desulfovibrio sp. OttesenSCG-928-A18]|nr:sigma-54 dependent transcriptional regulator [Desulfovibrio sp. OttesenSCG-928-A18]